MLTPNAASPAATAPMGVPGIDTTQLSVRAHPGIVIFVHGVNSDGEWYEAAEAGLCAGLTERLGLDKSLDGAYKLESAQYEAELLSDGRLNSKLDGKNFITHEGFSPVIRFRWGYKAAGKDGTADSEDEREVYKSKVYLNELDAWGGGPFQNGTTALPYMWGVGLDDRVFWWLYANMFPVAGREVYACPPRAYFAHAAHRLKGLIRIIRSKQDDCPITVVCHSQGNMVTLAAAFLGEKENALADSYVLCNPPYSLDSLGADQLVNHGSEALGSPPADGTSTPQPYWDEQSGVYKDPEAPFFGSVTTEARKDTFKNFLQLIRTRASAGQTRDLINKHLAFKDPSSGVTRFQLESFPERAGAELQPGIDRDNRGRVFLYCNPHDQVIGVRAVEGIGWKGVSQKQFDELGAQGVFHQRVWAQPGGRQEPPFQVGCKGWTDRAYEYIGHNYDIKQFWNPRPPAMRFALTLNENQNVAAKIVTILTWPIAWFLTHLPGLSLRLNTDPPKDWCVPINAPVLPQPLTPQARRYGIDGKFDEGHDASKDALAAKDNKAQGRPNDGVFGDAYTGVGQGTEHTEAALRYEHTARLKAATARGVIHDADDERAAVARMMEEDPNATDHSTILTNPLHSQRVLAYDVAVGWLNPSKITSEDLNEFRRFAHWMMLNKFELDSSLRDQFKKYWEWGFYNGLQLHRTYTMEHMNIHASGIVDKERTRGFMGYIK